MTAKMMHQLAPYPYLLADHVQRSLYRKHEGWSVELVDECVRDPADTHDGEGRGLSLIIHTLGYNTYHPERGNTYSVSHLFIVPAATYNSSNWLRWLFECYAQVELHEAMENFAIENVDGTVDRPFAPNHGPGENPYIVHSPSTDIERATSFRGVVKST